MGIASVPILGIVGVSEKIDPETIKRSNAARGNKITDKRAAGIASKLNRRYGSEDVECSVGGAKGGGFVSSGWNKPRKVRKGK